MAISTVLCISAFLLCCTGAAERTCRRLGVCTGSVAALSLLTAALGATDIVISEHVSIQPAVMLLAVCGALLCKRKRMWLHAVLLASACGVAAWVLKCAFPTFYEPGVLFALPAALTGRFFLRGRRQGLLCVLLAPLFLGFIVTVEDWYLFDYVELSLGNALQLDMQVGGATLYALLMAVQKRVAAGRLAAQKEA